MNANLIAAIGAIVVFMSGCSTFTTPVAPRPTADFKPNAQQGVVFGQSQFVLNGKVIVEKELPKRAPAQIANHISRFTSIQALEYSQFKTSEYYFSAVAKQDGWFSMVLPVGRYYFVEFVYINLMPRIFTSANLPDGYSWRTYMGQNFPIQTGVCNPVVVTFDVVPGKATYVGNIRHVVSVEEMKDVIDRRTGRPFVFETLSIDIADGSGEATAWLHREYSNLENITTQIAAIQNGDKSRATPATIGVDGFSSATVFAQSATLKFCKDRGVHVAQQ